ncbi:HD domain-containing protein [Candidatus Uhrbacteria bacterium]|nr:HD domain-containing protein [Candidatus Uhrbacteria bacterium]
MPDVFAQAEELVRTRIPGTRKGSDEPAYKHSLRVADTLKSHGYPDEVVLAGILHDIVEDGATSFDELLRLGFSERTVGLVRLCTHDDMIEGGDARWIKMMAGLVDARDPQAWAIKAADLNDNLKSSHTMPPDRARFMREAKGPFFLRLSFNEIGSEPVWKELKSTVVSLQK